MFFSYNQNNSGGLFKGPAEYIIVEAETPKEADERAQDVGVYFDCYLASDCACCGQRWVKSFDAGSDKPEIYGYPKSDWEKEFPGRTILIYYKNNTKETIKIPFPEKKR